MCGGAGGTASPGCSAVFGTEAHAPSPRATNAAITCPLVIEQCASSLRLSAARRKRERRLALPGDGRRNGRAGRDRKAEPETGAAPRRRLDLHFAVVQLD